MTPYKELADRLEKFAANCCIPDDENTPPREAAAILRSLDAQPVEAYQVMISRSTQFLIKRADVAHETATRLKDWLGSDANVTVRPLYAAPVAAVRKAMARLADLLDEDKFMEIEGIFTSAGFTPPVAAQASKPLSDAEIESGVPMHRKGSIAFRDGVRWAEQRHGIKERAMCENSMLSDADFAFDMLALMFDAYENGVTCYEDPEDEVGFIGYAYRLADDDFQNIATFLNRVRPVQPGSKERG